MPTAMLSPSSVTAAPLRRDLAAVIVVSLGLLVASAYGVLASDPYQGLPAATVTGAHAQDACSVLVAVGLLALGRSVSARVHLVRLGLFTILWAGVVAALLRGDPVHLGADAGPSLLMVAVCCWLLVRWLRVLADTFDAVRPTFWPEETAPPPVIMRP